MLIGLRRTVAGHPLQAGIKTRVVRKRLKYLAQLAAEQLTEATDQTTNLQQAQELRHYAEQIKQAYMPLVTVNGALDKGEGKMKITIQIVIEHESWAAPMIEEVACLCRGDLVPENLGLTLAEGKTLLAKIQEKMVFHQATESVEPHRACPHCEKQRGNKGKHEIVHRSLFGKLHILSPRLYTCTCQPQEKRSFSPLAEILPERTAPEFRYLQSKWASLMSYGVSVKLLEEVLPFEAHTTTLQRHTLDVAEKLEAGLGEERHMYVDLCERDWETLPDPAPPLTVGIDGGYVHARDGYIEVAVAVLTTVFVAQAYKGVPGSQAA